MSERINRNAAYVATEEGIKQLSAPFPEHRYNLERLRFQTIIHDSLPAKSVWYGSSHGDESESAFVQEEVNRQYPFSRVEAWDSHELASRMNLRTYTVPAHEEHATLYGPRVVSGRGVPGIEIDLNRQFVPNGHIPQNWNEAIAEIPYGPAKMQLMLVRDHPEVEVMVSVHEDRDRGKRTGLLGKLPFAKKRDGLYVYDVRERPDDPLDRSVDAQFDVFRGCCRKYGFDLFSGIDDPALGNRVRNGLIRQSAYDRNGNRTLDNTLEMYLVYLKSIGIGNIKRAFVVEVPGAMDAAKKKELLTLLSDTFFFPILGELNAL